MAEDALAWMQLRAMINGSMPVDKDFVAAEFQKRSAAAQAFLTQGDVLSAWRADQTIVNDFSKLHDVTATEQEIKRMDASKDLQRAKKSEKESLDQQDRVQGTLFPFVNFLGTAETIVPLFCNWKRPSMIRHQSFGQNQSY